MGLKAGLIADSYLDATRIIRHKKSYTDYAITPELLARIERVHGGVLSLSLSSIPTYTHSLILSPECRTGSVWADGALDCTRDLRP